MIARRTGRKTNTHLYSFLNHEKIFEVLIDDQGSDIISEVKLHTYYKGTPHKQKRGRNATS